MGNSSAKNNNKKLSSEDRRRIFTKKPDRKKFSHETVAREDLEDLHKENVEVNGELIVFKRREPFEPSLLQDVYVDGVYVDHVWVTFHVKDRKKLKYCEKGSRVYFTATVHEYCKRHDRHLKKKYGLSEISLIQE